MPARDLALPDRQARPVQGDPAAGAAGPLGPAGGAASDGSLLERLADREQSLEIYRQLHRLEDPYREVFLLRVLGELKFKEIAGIWGKSESWAKVTFYRAKDKLLERMEEKDED